MKEKLTPSERKHRRKILAKTRREVSPDFFEQESRNKIQTERRLAEVGDVLEDGILTPEQKANLELELIWLRFKTDLISSRDRQSFMQRKLNELKKENPQVFEDLITENGEGKTKLARIRDRVIPRTKIGGYYAKRKQKRG